MKSTTSLNGWLQKNGNPNSGKPIQKRPPSCIKISDNENEPKQKQVKLGHSQEHLKPAPHSQNSVETLSWVDKYKPMSMKQLIAQQGDKSPMNKLLYWLKNWEKLHSGPRANEKKGRSVPWKTEDGSAFKAVLLSGVPGIGKTTCAQMACTDLGMAFVEMNASDTRNKKQLDNTVAQLIACQQIDPLLSKRPIEDKKQKRSNATHVLIMDEVDGMSGNQDRAGMQELIAMIKRTRIPIICICNDRQSQKVRSLANYCFDLRFPRPRLEQIRSRMMTIAHLEKTKLSRERIDEIIEASNHDIRQCIYNLQLVSKGANQQDLISKDVDINIFEAGRKLLSNETSLLDKMRLFFSDYSLMPLFVHENYPNVSSRQQKGGLLGRLDAMRKAADSISLGDVTDRLIRTNGCWSLLNELGMYSSAVPSSYLDGHLSCMLQFPAWLGKNSMRNRRARLLHQLSAHTCLHITASRHALLTDYIPLLRDRLTRPLIEQEQNGVREVIDLYDYYDMSREDSETVQELGLWPGRPDITSKIPPKIKAAVTRAFNKEKHMLPYVTDSAVSKSRKKKATAEVNESLLGFEMQEENNVNESSSDDEIAVVVKTKGKAGTMTASSAGKGRGRARAKVK